jgi:hypothetical protein
MDFMLLLLGIVLVAVIGAARGIVEGWKQSPARPIARPVLPSSSTDNSRPSMKRKREHQSFSIRECETFINASEGVLFINITETGERRPLPFHNMYALVMTPHQLVSELRWVPPTSCLVLCGDVALCSSVLELLESVPETPPIYMLNPPSRCEVA